jgi:hypothetical protein
VEAEIAGKRLGIGLRLLGKAVRHGAAAAAASTKPDSKSAAPVSASRAAPVTSTVKGLARGTKNFGQAVVGPVAHTSGVLWLEITGLFFALFALFFAQNTYNFRASWKTGPDHLHFLVYSGLTLLFTAFTASQFLKARQKEKKNRARQAAK